jgi:tetratricopeptide (TPR) repeat protein
VDRLRQYWDFDDLDASEARFRDLLDDEPVPERRTELLTQLARVEGLRGDFEHGEGLIAAAEQLAGASAVARARVDLERGRLFRSSGNADAALPLFESSFALAREAGEDYIAADAAHMAALAAPDTDGFVAWTRRGVELAEAEPAARYWLGPLYNNLGWHFYDAGEYEQALDAFQSALEAREQDPENEYAVQIARYAVAKALRALERPTEGLPLLELAAAWAERTGQPDPWIHEELAETYASLDRPAEARDHARCALALLPSADPGFEKDDERSGRLRRLADSDSG